MKQLFRLTTLFCSCAALALTAVAGPESIPSGKEMKQVAPAPAPECNWTGFYIGLNVGGQFGHSETNDPDGYWERGDGSSQRWGYDESGVVAGGQVGYNFQWNWLVLGIEADLGYMNLDGSGKEPWSGDVSEGGPNIGKTDSDFFTTIRGRLGFAWGHWLFYGTGGGIGVNYETRIDDDAEGVHGHKEDFNWGWTGGGGVEYMINCHWSVKAEYLRFALDKQDFHAFWSETGINYRFQGNTDGNIIRAGLNYKF